MSPPRNERSRPATNGTASSLVNPGQELGSNGTRNDTVSALRHALREARRRRDVDTVRILVRWLSEAAA